MLVQAWRSSRVTGSAYGSSLFTQFVPEVGFPVGSYKSLAFGAGSPGSVAVSAAPLAHPLVDVIDNSVDDVHEGVVPCGGTGSKVSARRAGARGVIRTERALSTGHPVHGRRVEDERRFLAAPDGGVHFGVYTGPMTTQTTSALVVLTAPLGAVSR
jgi:hypothetical protein